MNRNFHLKNMTSQSPGQSGLIMHGCFSNKYLVSEGASVVTTTLFVSIWHFTKVLLFRHLVVRGIFRDGFDKY